MVTKPLFSFITHLLTPKSTELNEVAKSLQASAHVCLKYEFLNKKRNRHKSIAPQEMYPENLLKGKNQNFC